MHASPAPRRHARQVSQLGLVALLAALLHVVGATTPAQAQPPTGYVDSASSTSPGTISLAGWAYDPDSPDAPTTVRVVVENQSVGQFIAATWRPDVGPHGFSGTLEVPMSGTLHYYVTVDDVQGGPGNLIHSGYIAVANPDPTGAIDVASSTHRSVLVTGWANDPNAPNSPVQVEVYIGGTSTTPGVEFHSVTANLRRTDGRLGLSRYFTTAKTGLQDIYVYAKNLEGTPGKDQPLAHVRLTIYVDTAPPQTTITSVPRTATTNDAIRVEFSSSEPNSTFQCRWDEGAWAACVGHTTISLTPGNHMVSVRATDMYGNTDPTPATAVVTVTAATPPPPPPGTPAGPTVEARAVKKKSKLRIDVGPDSGELNYRVVIQRKVDKLWRKVDRVRTRGDRDVVVVDLRRGTYRVVLAASSPGAAIRSSTVRLKR